MVPVALALGVVSGVTLALDSAVGRARPARPARRVTAGRIAERGTVHARLALGRHFLFFFFIFFFYHHFILGHVLGGRRVVDRERIRSAFDRAQTGNARAGRAFRAEDRDVRPSRFVLLRWSRSHSADESLKRKIRGTKIQNW